MLENDLANELYAGKSSRWNHASAFIIPYDGN